jgi:hypothetical protein
MPLSERCLPVDLQLVPHRSFFEAEEALKEVHRSCADVLSEIEIAQVVNGRLLASRENSSAVIRARICTKIRYAPPDP